MSETMDTSANQPTAYCQSCGRGLTAETARRVGASVYCEPCLEARVGGGGVPPAPGYAPVGAGMPDGGWVAPVPVHGAPNPALAFWLGFIPGVGAMYNEQYAKGFVHLIAFILLVSLSDVNGLFGIFIAGWEFYMAIEAQRTAQARRDGLPLPNPFGLNDIGERLGFGKSWGHAAAGTGGPNAGSTSGAAWTAPAADPRQQAWQASAEQYAQNLREQATAQAYQDAYGGAGVPPPPYNPVANAGPGVPYGGVPPYGAVPPPVAPGYVPAVRRFPAGAVWLIGLGCFFLLMTTGLFESIHINALIGVGLIGLAVWTFIRRMGETGANLMDDGSPMYKYRLYRALRGTIWLAFIGLWFLLGSFSSLNFHRMWPIFIILAGVMALVERLLLNSSASVMPPYAAGYAVPPAGAPEPVGPVSTSIVPTIPFDSQKGGN